MSWDHDCDKRRFRKDFHDDRFDDFDFHDRKKKDFVCKCECKCRCKFRFRKPCSDWD